MVNLAIWRQSWAFWRRFCTLWRQIDQIHWRWVPKTGLFNFQQVYNCCGKSISLAVFCKWTSIINSISISWKISSTTFYLTTIFIFQPLKYLEYLNREYSLRVSSPSGKEEEVLDIRCLILANLFFFLDHQKMFKV